MKRLKPIPAKFYRTARGNEPVREWLKGLDLEDRKVIGRDIQTVQFGWPIGMPLVDNIERDIWEVRSKMKNGIGRVLICDDRRRNCVATRICKENSGNA